MNRLKKYRYGGYDKEFYEKYHKEIQNKNYETLKGISILAAATWLGLFLLTFAVPVIAHNRLVYLGFAISGSAVVLLTFLLVRKRRSLTQPVFYLMLLNIFLFSIVLGTYGSRNSSATTFCVLLVALPILLVNKPWRMDLFLLGITALHIIFVYIYKDPGQRSLDTVNAISFCIVSWVCNYQVTKAALGSIRTTAYFRDQSGIDGLTKLMNRAAVEAAISENLQIDNVHAVLMIIDVDNFKAVNDTLGHQYGDKLLTQIAGELKGLFRATDYVSRLGGDEFIIYLHNISDTEWVKDKAEMILKVTKHTVSDGEKACDVSCSIGISMAPENGRSYEELYKKADDALYKVKRDKKCDYALYSLKAEEREED